MQSEGNLTFFITFLGCKVNSYEVECIANDLEKKGYVLYQEDDLKDPNIVIINTCAVTKTSENKSNKTIKHYRNLFPNSIIIVMGCFSEVNKQKCVDSGANIVIGTKGRSDVLNLIDEYKKNKKTIFSNESAFKEKVYENISLSHFLFNTRAYLKIQDGCNNFCSYCLIPYLRGRSRSRKKEDILLEVENLIKNNYKEIVITGIDLGSYGIDLYENYRFSDLLEEILIKFPSLYRIRISSIEESQIDDKFIQLLKKYPNIANHLHIPLQSGSQDILKAMHRKYNLDSFFEKISKIREVRSDIAITTDVIVGFPSESDINFKETYDTIKKINFSKVHVFPYSNREGTLASKMPNQINNEIKKYRVHQLISLSNSLEANYKKKFYGKEIEFLFEHQKGNYFIGHSSNFLEIKVLSDENLNGKIKTLKYVK